MRYVRVRSRATCAKHTHACDLRLAPHSSFNPRMPKQVVCEDCQEMLDSDTSVLERDLMAWNPDLFHT